jgi:hypothetical protein
MRPIQKIIKAKKAWDMPEVTEHLPGKHKHKVLNSNPSTITKKKKKIVD